MKGSIMAHKVKVIDGNTFRLPIACTSPYNADYDGGTSKKNVVCR